MRKSAPPSPLRDAAEALDRELERYGSLAAELKRESATSEKGLRRCARLLAGLGETEQLLAQHLGRLVAAIDARRQTQEANAAEVQRVAAMVQERSALFQHLLERCDALGKRTAVVNAELQERTADGSAPDAAFERTAAGLEELAGEAQAIGDAARAGNFPDVARQTDGLHAQLLSAHKKVLAMCERSATDRIVH
jgi:uncharacterized coiled-coil DUF342 family protein